MINATDNDQIRIESTTGATTLLGSKWRQCYAYAGKACGALKSAELALEEAAKILAGSAGFPGVASLMRNHAQACRNVIREAP